VASEDLWWKSRRGRSGDGWRSTQEAKRRIERTTPDWFPRTRFVTDELTSQIEPEDVQVNSGLGRTTGSSPARPYSMSKLIACCRLTFP
jgi:hypothetical protein